MKFVCMGFADPNIFERLSPTELSAAMEECFTYDDELRRGGHFVGGEGLHPPQQAVTLRLQDGAVTATDGPYIETKEWLVGFYLVDCADEAEAIERARTICSDDAHVIEVRPVVWKWRP